MEVLAKGKYLSLKKEGTWEYAERTGYASAVIIIPYTEDNEVILVEQRRVSLGKNVIEFPAGLVGDEEGCENEDFYTTAIRELKEETGYVPISPIRHLGHFCTSPGLTNEKVHLVRVKVKKEKDAVPEEGIKVHVVRLDNLETWLIEKSEDCEISIKVHLYSLKYEICDFTYDRIEEARCACSNDIPVTLRDSFFKRVLANFFNNILSWTIAICLSLSIGSCTIKEIVNAWK